MVDEALSCVCGTMTRFLGLPVSDWLRCLLKGTVWAWRSWDGDCSLVGVQSLNLDLDRSRPGSRPLFWRWGGGKRGGAVSGGGPALFDPVPGSMAGSWVKGGVGTGGCGLVRGCGGALTVSCGGGGLVRGGGSGQAGAAVGAPHLLMPAAFAIGSGHRCKPAGDLPRVWRLLESAGS